MRQTTLAMAGFDRYAKKTRKAAFLEEMDKITLSIGVQKGPPFGVQKGPLLRGFVMLMWAADSALPATEGGRSPTGGAGSAARRFSRSAAMFETPAFVACLDDVAVMGNPIEQRGSHLGVAENGRPLAKGEVGGDDHRRAFVELADEVKQQLSARSGKGQIAQFVQDDEVEAGQLCGQDARLTPPAFLLKTVHQVDRVEVPAAGAGSHHAGRDGYGEMAFSGSGSANKYDIALLRKERAGVERAHLRFLNRCVGKDKRIKVLDRRQPSRRHPVADRGRLPVGCFRAQQIAQNLHGRAFALQARGNGLVERIGHALQAECGHGADQLMPLH